jgi:hypothetical protein
MDSRKHRHRRTNSNDDHSHNDDDDRRRKKKKKKRTKHSRKKDSSSHRSSKKLVRKKHQYDDDQERSDSSRTSSSSSVDKKHKKRKRDTRSYSDKDTTKSKHGKRSSRDANRKEEEEENSQQLTAALEFSSALYALLDQFHDMGEQLISMLYRMSSGTSFDLNQVNPMQLRMLLTNVFKTLQRYGIEQTAEGSWYWREATTQIRNSASATDRKRRTEMILINLVRQLLNDAGLTMEAIDTYEKEEEEALQKQQLQQKEHSHILPSSELFQALNTILSTFGGIAGAANPPLELEISGLFDSILQGEAVAIDGIPNENLRFELEKLFQLIGLEKVETEEESLDDTERHEKVYALPEIINDEEDAVSSTAARNLAVAIRNECHHRAAAMKKSSIAPVELKRGLVGPGYPASASDYNEGGDDVMSSIPDNEDDDSSSDDEGPALVSSEKSKRRLLIQKRRITKEEAKQLVRSDATGKVFDTDAATPSDTAVKGREEWMLFPGKHTFLEGIMKKGPTVNRQFKNEKMPVSSSQQPGVHVDPSVRLEMEQLIQLKQQQQERGTPSLMQLHQEKIAKAARKGDKQKEWKWSRDDDLDKGRRVDKDALRSMLGSAEENLKTKFGGTFMSNFT